MPMEIIMKDNGKIIKLMVMEFSFIQMDQNMKVNGLMINKRDMVLRPGRTRLFIEETI